MATLQTQHTLQKRSLWKDRPDPPKQRRTARTTRSARIRWDPVDPGEQTGVTWSQAWPTGVAFRPLSSGCDRHPEISSTKTPGAPENQRTSKDAPLRPEKKTDHLFKGRTSHHIHHVRVMWLWVMWHDPQPPKSPVDPLFWGRSMLFMLVDPHPCISLSGLPTLGWFSCRTIMFIPYTASLLLCINL